MASTSGLLRDGIERDRACERAHRIQHADRHLPDRAIGSQWRPSQLTGAVLDDRLVRMQVERDYQRPEPSGAGSGGVSQPRAVNLSAACWSWGSGGASLAVSLPSTCVCACSVSSVGCQAP